MSDKNDTTKFWTILLIMLLAVAVTVTLLDLGIKASILAEANSIRQAMADWKNNGEEISGRADQRNHSNGRFDAGLSGDVLATDDAGMEAGNAANGATPPTRKRPRNRAFPLPSDTD
jgi:hypothetical protein